MKTLIISLSLVLILILSGCKDNSTQTLDTSVIWPLKVGNYWEFQHFGISEIIDSVIILVDRDTLDYKLIKYHLTESLISSPWVLNNFYFNNDSGFVDSHGNYSNLVYKYPAKQNDFYYDYIYLDSVISTNKDVTVPAGTFKCYEYHKIESPPGYFFQSFTIVYLSPGIGPIKVEQYSQFLGETILINSKKLISYKLY